jgi:hypothetical protein
MCNIKFGRQINYDELERNWAKLSWSDQGIVSAFPLMTVENTENSIVVASVVIQTKHFRNSSLHRYVCTSLFSICARILVSGFSGEQIFMFADRRLCALTVSSHTFHPFVTDEYTDTKHRWWVFSICVKHDVRFSARALCVSKSFTCIPRAHYCTQQCTTRIRYIWFSSRYSPLLYLYVPPDPSNIDSSRESVCS